MYLDLLQVTTARYYLSQSLTAVLLKMSKCYNFLIIFLFLFSKVRVTAQALLHEFENHTHGALVQKLLQPSLLTNLKVDSVEKHELFKVFGTSYQLM